MPRIQEYSPRVSPSGPVPVPDLSTGGADIARGLSNLGAGLYQAGAAMKEREERRDATDASARLLQYRAERTAALQQQVRELNVNDPDAVDTFVQKFNEETANGLAELEGTAKTDRGRDEYLTHGARLMADLSERAIAEQAALGGKHDRNTVEGAYAYGSSAVRADPTQYDAILQAADSIVDGQKYLDGADREKLKQDGRFALGTDFVRGMIDANPDAAFEGLKKGAWDDRLGKDAKNVLIGEAEQAIRARQTEADRIRAERLRAKKEAQQATADGFYTRLYEGDLSMKEVIQSNLDAFGENSKEEFRKLIQAHADDQAHPIRTVQSEFTKLTSRVWAGEVTSLSEIRQAYTDKKIISREDEQWLEGQWTDLQTPDGSRLGQVQKQFLDGIKPQIDKSNPLMGNLDPSGAEMFAQFQREVAAKVAAQRAAKKDPFALFDRNSPEYLGPLAASFRTTMQQSMNNINRTISGQPATAPGPSKAPAVEPRKPGESAADYLRRTGGK